MENFAIFKIYLKLCFQILNSCVINLKQFKLFLQLKKLLTKDVL